MVSDNIDPPRDKQPRKPMQPTFQQILDNLPPNAVAVNLWRVASEYGPDPMTLVLSRESYDKVRKQIEVAGRISPDDLYVMESPLGPDGRKTVVHMTRLVGIIAFINTSIVPGKVNG